MRAVYYLLLGEACQSIFRLASLLNSLRKIIYDFILFNTHDYDDKDKNFERNKAGACLKEG